MKMAISLALLSWGLVVSLWAHADSAPVTHPVWVIVMTITNVTTGEQIEEQELDPELEFDDLAQCESIVAKAGPIPESHELATVLACREVSRI
jgi:hypothetical protein